MFDISSNLLAAPQLQEEPERAAVIDLEAIRHNIRQFVGLARPAMLMAVVKADAYGHGAVPVAKAALEAGAHWLGVAHISEAIELRAAGINAPLLAWLHTPRSDFSTAVSLGIDIGASGWEFPQIVAAVREHGRPATIHLKVDTGLGRNGATLEHWPEVLKLTRQYQDQGLIKVGGVFSHLATADDPQRPETDLQIAQFRNALQIAEKNGIHPYLRHLANTPATLTRPDTHFDMVRVGVGIYGLSPFRDETSSMIGLRPAMTLRTFVSNVKVVPAGQGVSYGLNYRTSEETSLALVPLGYGDGVPRTANNGPVSINGKTYPVVGRIAMDQVVVDLGEVSEKDAASLIGAEAVLFGSGEDGGPTADNWATAAGTINYEIVTRISPRVPRTYRDRPAV